MYVGTPSEAIRVIDTGARFLAQSIESDGDLSGHIGMVTIRLAREAAIVAGKSYLIRHINANGDICDMDFMDANQMDIISRKLSQRSGELILGTVINAYIYEGFGFDTDDEYLQFRQRVNAQVSHPEEFPLGTINSDGIV